LTPASTVYSDATVKNGPLVIQSVDDALRAAIELHDLPTPDEGQHFGGGGCPLPRLPANLLGGVNYPNGAADICPPYASALSKTHRGDAREVIARYRSLSASDQQAIIEFLKQL
jgi:hypothetical protein